MPKALYLHVPFCPHVCPYCDFHRMRRNEGLVAAYLERLEQEARALHRAFPGPLDTIYLGGGTPSHLSDEELARVTTVLRETWGFPAQLETTLEADPLTFDAARLDAFRTLGFDRLSIGLQSTQDGVLRFLGRLHDGRQGLEAVTLALAAGFRTSADLITAVPGQDAAADLHAVAASGVPHVSVYTLTVEPHTPFALRRVRVDEDLAADDFERAAEILGSYGLERYEVSNHARPGHESLHNQAYWRGDYYLALGPSAASFLPLRGNGATEPEGGDGPVGERLANPPLKAWLAGAAPERQPVSPLDHALETLMTGLRTRWGVDLEAVRRRCGIRIEERFEGVLAAAEKHALLVRDGRRLRASPTGLMRLDSVLRAFFRA